MATEEGIVVRTDTGSAWIKTVKSGACQSCSAQGYCHSLGGGRDVEVHALNPVAAKVGDRVLIGFETGPLMKVSFMLYIVPILALIVGAAVGQGVAPFLSLNPQASSILMGFLLVFLSFWWIRKKSNQLAGKDRYRPKILRTLAAGQPLPGEP